jgi:16S rRNA (guanine966-N2)-methyltransferase
VRITGGAWRSRRLKGPGKLETLRPTPDAMRERVFAVLADRVHRAAVLDLYAGTGAIGLEALSRGADRVVFVERHRSAVELIRSNCAAFELGGERVRLIAREARPSVDLLIAERAVFDLAWADPPFESWLDGLRVLTVVITSELLTPAAIACLECPEKADVANHLASGIEIVRDLKGGASRVVMLRAEMEAGCQALET